MKNDNIGAISDAMNGLVWWSAIKLAKAASRISRDQPSSIHPIEIARYTA